jgi:BirA family transcriptional regulator, biotin operon repressor / biotin---[acetyl-CoA-carboxylase] ligase
MPLDLETIRSVRPQNEFHYFKTIGSTMIEASRLAMAGAAHGTVVIAEEQTSGIGRLGRAWISEYAAGIYISVLLRLPLPPANLPVGSLLVGLATAEAIEKSTQLACDLRWPNDVLINERKVAGILPQLVGDCILAGIGINVNNESFPANLRTPATSLLLESDGCRQSRETIIVHLLEALDIFSDLLINRGTEAILRAFGAASSYVTNRRIIVEENGLRGTTAGLDSRGFLLVRSADGHTQRISSGGVRFDPEGAG